MFRDITLVPFQYNLEQISKPHSENVPVSNIYNPFRIRKIAGFEVHLYDHVCKGSLLIKASSHFPTSALETLPII